MRIAFTECRRRKRQEAACDREHGNARVRAVTALAKKAKARREQGVFLVEGPKMFGELPVERRREVYVSENFLRQQGEKQKNCWLAAGMRR